MNESYSLNLSKSELVSLLRLINANAKEPSSAYKGNVRSVMTLSSVYHKLIESFISFEE